MSKLLLGIDNGLTRIKATLCDLAGRVIASCSLPNTILPGKPGHSELPILEQWATTCAVVARLLEQAERSAAISPADVLAVACSGHGNGLYLIGRDGAPLRPAFTSIDHRAAGLVQRLRSDVREQLKEITLQDVWDAQPGMLLQWLKRHEPATYRAIGNVLLCKDWIRHCLTGRIATDYTDISATGLFDNRRRTYDDAILVLLGIPEMAGRLPEVVSGCQIVGQVTPEAAGRTGLTAGTPVAGGLFDVVANPLGSGLTCEGTLCLIAGTWNINVALTLRPLVPARIRQCTIYSDERFYACIDSSVTSASNLEWFLQHVLGGHYGYEEFERAIAGHRPHEADPLFMPFVHSGLRNDDPGAAFYGLRSKIGRDDMLSAIAEGVAFAHRYHVQNLAAEGLTGHRVLLTGGASRSRAWCQVFADVLDTPVSVPASLETGALGACIVASVAAGACADVEEAVRSMVSVGRVYRPHPSRAPIFAQRYAHFVGLLDSPRP